VAAGDRIPLLILSEDQEVDGQHPRIEKENAVPVSAVEAPQTEGILTPLALNRLLEWLDDGLDSNGERYLEMHRKLLSYFDRRNRFAADELADETFRRIARTLEQSGEIVTKPPARYCYVVARFVLLEDIRRSRKQVPFDEVQSTVAERHGGAVRSDHGSITEERRFVCLDRCLRELRADERQLIVEYYGGARRKGGEHRFQMAERMGITKNALCIRATRIRERLMNCVAQHPDGRA
jgi:DNA-directed RNA polymerase specialized sigma24 family protein